MIGKEFFKKRRINKRKGNRADKRGKRKLFLNSSNFSSILRERKCTRKSKGGLETCSLSLILREKKKR